MSLLTTAAVLFRPGEAFRIEEVELESPGPNEVLVRVLSSGLCHSDWNAASGASATALPAVLGHEGSGIVEEIGALVSTVSAGDTVGLSWMPACGSCRYCARGSPELCEGALDKMVAGTLPSGAKRLRCKGEHLHHYSYLSTFARHAVVDERSCVVLPAGTDPEIAAIVGCAVMTGFCAVVNRAKVAPGSCVAVFGAGGVGLSAVMGARLSGAELIVAVEPVASRRALALEVGASSVLDPNSCDAPAEIVALTKGGADYAFEAAGVCDLVTQAFSATRPGGTVVAVGVPPDGSFVSLPAPELVRSERTLTGAFYGSARPALDMPLILRLYAEGRLPLGKLVGKRYRLDQLNEAFAQMHSATGARSLVDLRDPLPSPR